jgi:GTPase SAR1 family protein
VVRSFYKGVSAILLVYSVDDKNSFVELSGWLKEIREHSHPETIVFLVGTKLDLELQSGMRNVTSEEGKKYRKSINADAFMEVSAKTGENVKEVFFCHILKLFEKLGKILVRKYNESSVFRCLVSPMSTEDTPSKAESFNLKYDAFARRSLIRK